MTSREANAKIRALRSVSTTDGDFIVERYPIATTTTVVYRAWERSALVGPHGTVTRLDLLIDGNRIEGWFGDVSTKRPDGLDGLPVGEERFNRVAGWYAGQYAIAQTAIVAAFPEARIGRRQDGEIVMTAAAVLAAAVVSEEDR